MPADQPANEYAFWMANRARFSSVEKTQSDNFDLLLVIDVASDEAASIAGYGLEPYVSEEDLQMPLCKRSRRTTAQRRPGRTASTPCIRL